RRHERRDKGTAQSVQYPQRGSKSIVTEKAPPGYKKQGPKPAGARFQSLGFPFQGLATNPKRQRGILLSLADASGWCGFCALALMVQHELRTIQQCPVNLGHRLARVAGTAAGLDVTHQLGRLVLPREP